MRILFVTATRVGDAVLSTGVLGCLLDRNPGASVTIVCGAAAAGLFEAVPGLERIIILNKKRFSVHWLDFWLATVGRVWDYVVDLRNAPATYLVPHRKGVHLGSRYMNAHRVIRNASAIGMAEDAPPPRLWSTSEQDDRAATLLADDGRPVIALGPVANWKPKTWPATRFLELVQRLGGDSGPLTGARVAVFGTMQERPRAAPLLERIPAPDRIDLMGVVSLPELYACLKQCSIFIGNDSGLMHMAAASGIPTVGLFGPSREDHYGPWGTHCRSVRGDLGYDEIFPPDYDYRNSDHWELMSGLGVERVEGVVTDLLDEVRRG